MNSTRSFGPTTAALAIVVALIALLSLAASAGAATVTQEGGVIRWTGTAQADEVRVDYKEGRASFIDQTGSPQTAGAGCDQGDSANVAYCTVPAGTKVIVDLGDGNDRLDNGFDPTTALNIEANGGPGSDDLRGNGGNDVLVGGPGQDQLTGFAGDDVLDVQDGGEEGFNTQDCGDGNDVLKVDANGVDIEGGAQACESIQKATPLGGTAQGGFDDTRVQYKAQPGVANNLTVQKTGDDLRFTDPAGVNAGQGCERENATDPTTVICRAAGRDSYATDIDLGDGNDTLKVVEAPEGASPTYKGGAGNDRIEGGAESSTIEGGPGDDTLIGRGGGDRLKGEDGNDKLDGGAGFDTFDGGAGNDTIESRDGSYKTGRNDVLGESIGCGSGRDTLTADVSDAPGSGCEKFRKADTSPRAAGTLQIVGRATFKLTGKTPGFNFKVKCVGGPCEGRAYFFTDRRYSAPFNATKSAFKLAAGQTATQRIAFGSGYGAFRESVGKRGKVKAYLATLVGDANGRTKTVRKTITLTAKKGLR